MWALIRKARVVVALLSAAALSRAAVAAQLQGFVWICGEKQQLCYWHKVVVAGPKGWTEDEAWTMRYKAKVMFPNGDKSKSKPVMYVRAHHGEKDLGLDKYVAVAQERWKKRLPDSTIEALPDR